MAKGTSNMALPTNLDLSSVSSKFNIRLSSFLSSITEGRKLMRVQMMAMDHVNIVDVVHCLQNTIALQFVPIP